MHESWIDDWISATLITMKASFHTEVSGLKISQISPLEHFVQLWLCLLFKLGNSLMSLECRLSVFFFINFYLALGKNCVQKDRKLQGCFSNDLLHLSLLSSVMCLEKVTRHCAVFFLQVEEPGNLRSAAICALLFQSEENNNNNKATESKMKILQPSEHPVSLLWFNNREKYLFTILVLTILLWC